MKEDFSPRRTSDLHTNKTHSNLLLALVISLYSAGKYRSTGSCLPECLPWTSHHIGDR